MTGKSTMITLNGEGIVASGVDRGEVFVTTKLRLSDFGHDATLRAFDTSLVTTIRTHTGQGVAVARGHSKGERNEEA
ncbi:MULTISPECIES: hypothetical protein [Streptomyces]|jgi:hypothetical protein|uniref:Uncharacterized protein n=1 Tax=Streptomyces sp. 900129855 TaxID=3155129 RepID=A0ABV2ZCF2_9ACTN